jgi:hypothetical protein
VTRLRIGLALAGFLAALLAVSRQDERIGWAGIALLSGSLLVKVVQKRYSQKDMDAPQDKNDSL